MTEKFDFAGWATKNDILCADGRTIRDGAFRENDGQTVPLVYQHQHNDPKNVIGHALLEYKPGEGMYCYARCNNTENGRLIKEEVAHGDLTAFSIYANQLKQHGGDVVHGRIREVSVVLAPANDGAVIEYPVLAHSGETVYDEAIISGAPNGIDLIHADGDEKEKEDMAKDEPKNNAPEEDDNGETVKDVFDTLNEKQKKVVYFMIGQALEDAKSDDNNSDDEEEDTKLTHNVFDQDSGAAAAVITKEEMTQIFADGKRLGSLKDSVLQHMDNNEALAHAFGDVPGVGGVDYGITDIDYLFPEAKRLDNGAPEFLRRPDDWVSVVMGGVHHSAFSRIKSMFANITADEARARGYTKGKKKLEEVFTLLKRVTTPQTVYKKQKLDRDDIIDITDFSVVAWIKGEMRLMLDEELARAYLIGDGRSSAADDKIHEDHIRPIATDDGLFTISATVASGNDEYDTAKNFIKAAIRSRKNYKGSGNPILFTTEDLLSSMLELTDDIGRDLYKTEAELATKLRVSRIVTVPVMEGYNVNGKGYLLGLIVNLNDYNVGADKGGAVSMFEDFDIDYNQEKYLIETRCSGALTKPFSAIALWTTTNHVGPTYTAVTPAQGADPAMEGWYEQSAAGNYFLTSDSEVKSGKTYYEKA